MMNYKKLGMLGDTFEYEYWQYPNMTLKNAEEEAIMLIGGKGPFKYYVIKEVGGWGQKMAILDDLQYCKSSKSWVGGPKKVKNMMT